MRHGTTPRKPDGWVLRPGFFHDKIQTTEDIMRLNFKRSLPALAVVASCAATASAASLVVNGDFQTGTFSGWTVNQTTNNPWRIASSGSNFYASDGCIGSPCITGPMPGQSYLYQDLSTVAGTSYTLNFDYSPGPGTPTELDVLFGSTVATDLLNVPNSTVTYSFTLLATGSTTRLEFLGRQDPSFDFLDNISVTSGVPEPSTFVLVGSSMLGLAGVIKRRLARSDK
jgi:hypothetical protein